MPELPEVETMVRGIRPAVEGKRIVEFRRTPCLCRAIPLRPDLAAIRRRCEGQTVAAVRRRAKKIVMELSGGDAFVIEPRMTGLVLVSDPPDTRHLRFEWRLAENRNQRSLWFWDQRGLGTVRLLNPRQLAETLGDKRLGPDALEMTADKWRARLKATRRPVKVALLDQKLVAGIGNLYASEILHLAGINPRRRANRLMAVEILRMAKAVVAVLEEAIRHEGSTLSDGTYRNALNEAGGYQNAHRVYDREDEPCPTCGHPEIRRIVQAQRSTFFCSRCQK
ncbi:MAG: bifunctional DNA-formamidopyrimidine glycosylase/DNA-(apurinic or apyrimidinic site) lyase [Deltaproteobacteria bacterium]